LHDDESASVPLKRDSSFFYFQDRIVLVHAFAKKTQQLKDRDIELAERRMEDWIERHSAGGIK